LCVNTNVDQANCGGCGVACGSGYTCKGGHCIEGCAAGLLLCSAWAGYDAGALPADAATGDAAPSDAGTEASSPPLTCVDPSRDEFNCGGCGKVCAIDQACVATACTYGTSCRNLLQLKGPLGDGTYTIDPDGAGPIKPFAVYCAGMNTAAPKEYLNLVNTIESGFPGSNTIMAPGGGACGCATSPVTRYFTKVHLLVPSLVVDQADLTFSFLQDPSVSACWMTQAGACGSYLDTPYGLANDCMGGGDASATADVDLTGTPFSIDPSVMVQVAGYYPGGSYTFNATRTKLDETGGGYCGGTGPSGALQLKQN
jgi:hypothetical protein